jgi:ribosome-binding factor A
MAKQHGSRGQTQRQLRVGEIIRHAFAEILMRSEIVDPEFDGQDVTVTEVRVSPDMRNATIYTARCARRQGVAQSVEQFPPR